MNRWYENSAVLLLYVLLTMVMTYPAFMFLHTKVLGGPGDNFHFLWELWYVAHALFDLHKSPFFDPDIFVPFGYSLIRNQDLSPGTVLLFSPLTHLFGEVFTYNFLVLGSFALTAFGTYLLARELWSNRVAAILAGVIVGFCPYRFTHATGHLSIVSTEWIPFFFLYLERLIARPRLRNAILAGLFFGLSAWTTWYYFFMLPIAAAAYVAFRIDWRLPPKELWRLFKWGLASGAVALILVLPFLVPYYLSTHGAAVDNRAAGESQAFAAALADYVIPPTTHFVWGPAVARLWRTGPNGRWQSEWQLYLGGAALLFAAAGVFHQRRRLVVALLATALVCFVFSFGPGLYVTHPAPLHPDGNDVALAHLAMPGRILRQLPGFNNLRGWARMGFFVELSVGLLAAAGLTRILDWLRQRLHAPTIVQRGVAAMAIAGVIFDFLPRPSYLSSAAPRPVDQWLSQRPGTFAFMEYPIPHAGYSGPAMYSTRLTGKSIIMGYASSPPNLAYWSDLSAFPLPSTLDLLYDWGTRYVLVDENLYRAGSSFWNIYQTWDTLESAIKQTHRLKQVADLQGVHVYQLESGTSQGKELLVNGSFEKSNKNHLPGWTIVRRPTIDRTSKYSAAGITACAVTAQDYLLSAPVLVEPGQCYRLSVQQRTGSKAASLSLQLRWKREDNADVAPATRLPVGAGLAQQWRQSEMIVRAPAEVTYTILKVAAATGKVWVDDLSLKNVPTNCEPVLLATPNKVDVPTGELGRAAVSWNTCCSFKSRVTLSINDSPDEFFAEGQSGLKFLDGIKEGTRYEFRLYSGEETFPAKTAILVRQKRTDSIVADPNPVPASSRLGRTRISWVMAAGADGEVCVSQNGGPEHVFARGASGSTEVPWIAPGSSYEFRLYTTEPPRQLVAKILVTMAPAADNKPR